MAAPVRHTDSGVPVFGVTDKQDLPEKYRGEHAAQFELEIPEGTEMIGEQAFYECSGLTDVSFPGTLIEIGRSAFDTCPGLTNATLPDGLAKIGLCAFRKSGLTSVACPATLAEVGENAFRDCGELVKVSNLPPAAKMAYNAFFGCGKLAAMSDTEGVVRPPAEFPAVGSFADPVRTDSGVPVFAVTNNQDLPENYRGRSGAQFTLEIPEGTEMIGETAFRQCSALTAVTLPHSLAAIGDKAFRECSGLTTITLPDSLTAIGREAFYRCSGLTTIKLPDAVTTLGEKAFDDVPFNTAFNLNTTNPLMLQCLLNCKNESAPLELARRVMAGLNSAHPKFDRGCMDHLQPYFHHSESTANAPAGAFAKLRQLLDAGGNPTAELCPGWSALDFAVHWGEIAAFTWLLHGRKPAVSVTPRTVMLAKACAHIPQIRAWGDAYGSFLGRYAIEEGAPKHLSSTCCVVFAKDLEAAETAKEQVVLKFMHHPAAFQREVDCRKDGLGDTDAVVSILAHHGGTTDSIPAGSLAAFPQVRLSTEAPDQATTLDLVLVLERGSTDLSDVISHGDLAGKSMVKVRAIATSIATCLREMHRCGFIHGDVKGRNFVMLPNGDYAAIDLDAAAAIDGATLAGQKPTSSGCLPPEQAAVLLHEHHRNMIRSAASNSESATEAVASQIKELKQRKKRAIDDDDDAEEDRLRTEIKALKQKAAAATTPPEPVVASGSYDMWCFGVLLYELATGRRLFDWDIREDVDDTELAKIAEWSDTEKELALARVADPSIKQLLGLLLHKDPERRPDSWADVIARLEQRDAALAVPLPPGKKHHFFVCHHQGSGGDQCSVLCHKLQARGFKVWYDNDQTAEQRNLQGMRRGVQESECLLLFLSGRKETAGQPDLNGQYEGPFTRWFCHEEMHAAGDHGLKVIGVAETDDRKGKPDFAQERARALTGKSGGLPINEHAGTNIHLLDDVRFIPFRRQEHEMPGMLDEIVRQRPGAEASAEASAEQFAATQAPAVPLPDGKETHFFVCHHEGSGGDQAKLLCDALRLGGFKVWHDTDQTADQRNFDRVRRGVEGSECLLVFLSGRKETGRQPDPDGQYESPFTTPLCHEAMHAAHVYGLRVVGVMESEKQKGEPYFELETARGMSSKHDHAATNVHLLSDVCFTPFRRAPHEWRAMLAEIARIRDVCPPLATPDTGNPDADDAGGGDVEPRRENSVHQDRSSGGGGDGDADQAPSAVGPSSGEHACMYVDETPIAPWLVANRVDTDLSAALDELGVKFAEDLLELEEYLPSLRERMRPLEQKKFDKALAALRVVTSS